MQPSLVKHLNRLAERRPDVAATVVHLWELSLTEFAVPLDGIGFPYGKHSGSATTLAVFRTSEPIPEDDKRLLRDLSAFDPGWLVDNLVTLAASKPWAGGIKRHHWPSWDYLFLDGWHSQPVELTYPAGLRAAEIVVPPRLWVVCDGIARVKPDGWFVELPNVLPHLADLLRGEAGEKAAPVAPRPGRAWKDGPPPVGWHPDYIEGKLWELVRVVGVRDKKTLLRYNGKSWWVWKWSGREFRLYGRTTGEYAHWKRKWQTIVKRDEKG